jgi:hypothetical protein
MITCINCNESLPLGAGSDLTGVTCPACGMPVNEVRSSLGRPPSKPKPAVAERPTTASPAAFNWTPDAVYKVGVRLMIAWFGICFVLSAIVFVVTLAVLAFSK